VRRRLALSLALTVAFAIVGAILVTLSKQEAAAQPISNDPRAFQRPPRAADQFRPHWPRHGRVIASRLVATYDGRARRASLYVFKTSTGEVCQALVFNGIGGGCNPKTLFRPNYRLAAGSGQLFAGIAADEVTRVVIIGSRGVRHNVRLTPDNGFIFDCRAYNGCPCVVARVDAFTRTGRRVVSQRWLAPTCSRKR
jgi:hypothetical protein